MLRRRFTIDLQPRAKNGHPAHNTTGVARANWIRVSMLPATDLWRRSPSINSINSGMASARSGIDRATPTHSLRLIFLSSGSASSATARGSSAMPHMGHSPGFCLTISGCMGQMYSAPTGPAGGATGSSAMPQSGQAPGPDCRTSGCIGQV